MSSTGKERFTCIAKTTPLCGIYDVILFFWILS
jgi:hypothetical protein